MKKVSFLSISFISILTGLFLLFGCNNGTRPDKNNSNNVDNNKKSYLSVSGVTVSGEKTAVPVFTNDTISDFVFTLKGKTADSDTEETLGTYEGLEALTSASIPVKAGNWEFTLLAAKDGTAFTGTKEMEIIAGNNTISFVLKWDEETLSGNGNLLFSLDFSKALNKLDVMLATGELIKYNPETKEETPEYHESPLDITDFKVNYELTDIPADIYRIKIHLYADTKKKLQINTYPGLAIITGGQTSTEAKEMDSLNSVCFIKVEGATITGAIGSGDSASKVFITDRTVPIGDLWVCDHEVTQGEYETYCMYGDSDTTNRPSSTIGLGAHFPVYFVSWYDALVYCNLRSKTEKLTPVYKMKDSNGELTDDPTKWAGIVSNNLTGEDARYCGPSEDNTDWNNVVCDWSANGYRLPTDAEWEYIARGGNGLIGTQYTYAGSNTADDVAWYSDNSGSKNHEIKGLNPSTLGLYDLSGNVWELCWDWYPDTSTETITATTDPYGISSGKERIKRGGSWTNKGTTYANVYNQNPNQPKDRVNHTGFRVVRNASFNPVIVKFDTTSNWPENTAQIDSVVIDKEGQTVSLPAYAGTRTGYTFKGWYTTATPGDSDEPFDFASPITDNITLYAVWEADFVLTESFTFAGEETLCEGDEDRESKAFIKDKVIPIGSLWVCDHEVTQGEYEQYCCYTGAPSSDDFGKGSDYPVYYVSWYDAIVYCNLRSEAEGLTPCYSLNGINDAKNWTGIKTVTEGGKTKYSCSYTESISAWDEITCDWNADGYRLPTSAEWEYAARGANLNSTEQKIYSGTDGTNGDLDNYAWHAENSGGKTHTVKGKLPNALNLYDMTGNVSEMCWDWHPADNTLRSVRSSGFSETHKLNAIGSVLPYGRYNYIGFRVVRSASFHSLLVTFDTTSNYPGNTAKVDSVVIDEADKKATEPAYSVKKNGYALKGWYTTANPTEADSPFNFDSSITESITLYAVWYAPTSVGDVLLTDGSIISYKAGRTFTDTEKANAVGVLYGFDEEGAPMGWVAKYHTDTHTGYVWATNDVTLGGTGFESIACTRTSESNNVDEGVTFEGDLDGSDNWKKVCEADTTAESNPEKYPVFDYVNKYGKDPTADYYFGGYLSETEYKDGWYLPSIAELACLFKNREKINDVLNALNEDGKPSTNTHYYSCWSSSLSQDASKCWVVTSNDWGETGYVDEINKNSNDSYRVVPVRK